MFCFNSNLSSYSDLKFFSIKHQVNAKKTFLLRNEPGEKSLHQREHKDIPETGTGDHKPHSIEIEIKSQRNFVYFSLDVTYFACSDNLSAVNRNP